MGGNKGFAICNLAEADFRAAGLDDLIHNNHGWMDGYSNIHDSCIQ